MVALEYKGDYMFWTCMGRIAMVSKLYMSRSHILTKDHMRARFGAAVRLTSLDN